MFPKEISPNPLLTSAVELRFTSTLSRESCLALSLSAFAPLFSIIKTGPIPYEARKEEVEFEFTPDFILSNTEFSISISDNMISFENVGDYKYWPKYFDFISTNLKVLEPLGIVDKVIRIGVRYTSLFSVLNPLDCLKSLPSIEVDKFTLDRTNNYSGSYSKGLVGLNLQIRPRINAVKDSITYSGVLIDIDAFQTSDLPPMGSHLLDVIDLLHSSEKEFLFSGLLKPEFIKTLNPKY